VIIASFFIFALAAHMYSKSETPVYQSSATVKVEERKTIAGLLTESIIYNPGDVMETQKKIITGFPVIKRAALALGLIKESESQTAISEVIGSLQSQVGTERIGQTNIIKIIVTSGHPKEAMDIAEAIAQAFVEENLSEKNKQARTARQFIEDQLVALAKKLRESEEELKGFGERGESGTLTVFDDADKKMSDLQFQLSTLLQKYTDKHPKIIQIKEQIAELRKQLKGSSGKELNYMRVKRDVEANRKIYDMLRERLEEVKITEAEKVPDVSIIDHALFSDAPTGGRSRIDLFLGGILGLVVGLVLSFLVETMDTSIGTIEDVESVVKLPILGVVPSIPYEEGKTKATFFDKIKRRFFNKRLTEAERSRLCLISHRHPDSPISESFRNLKTNIKLSSTNKMIMITSAGPQEGKTTIISNLGIVCAQDGLKTLLVSADLRRPALVSSFGVPHKPGLTEIITGTASLDDALKNISDCLLGHMDIDEVLKNPGLGYLYLLPSGALPFNPTEILGAKEFDILIAQLRERFDVILFDAPPILPVADASILAPKMDATLLCYEIGRTSRHALIRAKAQLESTKANILGVILNHTNPETEFAEVYPYYYKYKYYTQEKKEDKKKDD
jgi:capsular exopolysaccharide synthesis family protein